MTKAEAIKRMCRLQGAVHAHLRHSSASDCFCEDADMPGPYRNDGEVIAFIERAVKQAIGEGAGT